MSRVSRVCETVIRMMRNGVHGVVLEAPPVGGKPLFHVCACLIFNPTMKCVEAEPSFEKALEKVNSLTM